MEKCHQETLIQQLVATHYRSSAELCSASSKGILATQTRICFEGDVAKAAALAAFRANDWLDKVPVIENFRSLQDLSVVYICTVCS